ncbi:MAG: AbgT family transporter [Planctomycetota bacterium]
MSDPNARKSGLLDAVEWLGNKLPDPTVLFLIGAVIVMIASHLTAPPKREGVRYEPVAQADGELAVRVIDEASGEPLVNDSGAPIDLRDEAWVVVPQRPVEVLDPETGETVLQLEPIGTVEVSRSLLTSEGLYWCLQTMEDNFMGFAPLGVVLVGILGIGVAEKTGLIAALLKTFMLVVSRNFLTPTMVFLGIMSSVGSDAGYVVLPPLAAAIYLAAGRSPLAGIAAVFAGVSAGFNANLLITTLEPIMAEFSSDAAQIIDPERVVAPTASWWFMAVSTFVITGTGWMTSALFVEKRLSKKPAEDGGPDLSKAEPPAPTAWTPGLVAAIAGGALAIAMALAPWFPGVPEWLMGLRMPVWLVMSVLTTVAVFGVGAVVHVLAKKGLSEREANAAWASTVVLMGIPAIVACLAVIPGSPLYGNDGVFPRWVAVVVPIIFITFVIPGLLYGWMTGTVHSSKDAAKLLIESIAGMAPIIVLAFFAGQFIAYFTESNLGRMLAFTGGEWLFEQRLPTALLLIAFIAVTMVFNLFVGSMSAKYALFAPIFVPMFMLVGIRPEMTMVAYRIGDSVTNVITPLNAYLVIILVFMQKYAPKAGIGTLIAMMLPYTVVFAIVWTIMLLLWDFSGLPLGLGDPTTAMSPGATPATP